MGDVLAVLNVAVEGTSLCVKAINALKNFSQDVRSAADDLLIMLKRLERARNLLELLRITMMELLQTEFSSLSLALDGDDIHATLREILRLASRTAAGQVQIGMYKRLRWAAQASTTKQLLEKLERQEHDLMGVLMVINTASSLKTQRNVTTLAQSSVDKVAVRDAFENLTIVDDTYTAEDTPITLTGTVPPRRTWLGHVVIDKLPSRYVELRDQLSEAAYWGHWDQVFAIIEEGNLQFNESWVNGIRMKPSGLSSYQSYWTPLHQAVYNHAPIHVIQKLLDLGASRTLRTKWSDFSHLNLSPLELAQELGCAELYDILGPTLRNPVPNVILSEVQTNFHALIRRDLGYIVEAEKLYLPLLEPLTEMGSEVMWFPVWNLYQSSGYYFQLDGRELLVRAINIASHSQMDTYRITQDSIYQVDEALIVGEQRKPAVFPEPLPTPP